MFHGNILISEHLHLVLSRDQHFIQILPDIRLSALYLGPFLYYLFYFIYEILLVDLHFLQKFQQQTILHGKQTVQQMLLFNLLIAVLAGNLLTALNRFHRFLGKFIDIHKLSLLPPDIFHLQMPCDRPLMFSFFVLYLEI